MTIDRTKLSFLSSDKIDKIIGVHTGTLSVLAGGSSSDISIHGFGDSCYIQGVFSTDSGTTWNDFGAQTPDLSTPTAPVFQTLDCNSTVTTSELIVKAHSYTSSAYSAQFKVALIAKNSMAQAIDPLPTNEKLSLLGSYNYQKIAFQDTVSFSVSTGSSQTQTVTHNLGYKPKVRAWWFDASDPTTCRPLVPDDSISILYMQPEVRISNTDVKFVVDASGTFDVATSGNLEYRIYYDS